MLDTKKEDIAVTEANKLGIPIVAVVDTNCDPDVIDFVIPGNDDAIRSATLMSRIISDAVLEGRFIASRQGGPAEGPAVDRSAEEEAKVAQQQAEARRQAALAAAEREARIAEGQSAAETAAVAEAQPQPVEPGLTAENAENLLDDATAASAPAATETEKTEE